MLDLNIFKKLNIEEKIVYLSDVIHFIINDENLDKNSRIYLSRLSDTDLIELYEVILNPKKINTYIEKKWKEIKDWNAEIKNLETLLNHAKIEMQEKLEQENTDEILNKI